MSQESISRRTLTRHIGLAATTLLLSPRSAWAAEPTPSQVEGPFHPILQQLDTDLDLSQVKGRAGTAAGEVILVGGRVVDTEGNPLQNALVDVWQANHHGRYSHPEDRNPASLDPDFQGWGLLRTDEAGSYRFRTIKPGPYPLSSLGSEGWRCRHIHFQVAHAHGEPLTTQMYFAGDPLIEQDQEVAKVSADQRQRLISYAEQDPATLLPSYRFDLVLGSA